MELIGLIITGICLGSIYGLMALSLVLIFKATNLVNFSHGAMASLAVFLFVQIVVIDGMHPILGTAVALLAAAAMGIGFGFMAERMERRGGHIVPLIASFGLLIMLEALTVRVWATGQPYRMPALFGTGLVPLGDEQIPREYLVAMLASLLLASGLGAFFKMTSMGLQLRALVANAGMTELLGIPTRRLKLLAWGIGTSLGLASAYLYASVSTLSTGLMQVLLLKAFAAAVIGSFVSFRAAILGAIALGLMEAILGRYMASVIREVLAIAVVLSVVLILPRGLFTVKETRQ